MGRTICTAGSLLAGVAAVSLLGGSAWAAAPGEATIDQLRDDVEHLKEIVARQQERLQAHEGEVRAYRRWAADGGAAPPPEQRPALHYAAETAAPGARRPQAVVPQVAQSTADDAADAWAPAELRTVVPREFGILTRRGRLVAEPSLEFQHTDINRFVVGGIAILDTVLIGALEATQADRDSLTGAVSARYGITDRFEFEVRVPYVYRNDAVTNTVVSTNTAAAQTNNSEAGIGDVELAWRYQLNSGADNWPFLVANVRAKSPTGNGPFDVARNAQGIEQELPTGSGFWGVEGSITAIIPSDPVVFFGNLGYLWNVERNVDEGIGGSFISTVDPGDAVRMSFGLGVALNERTSLSIGYSHDFIAETRSRINGVNVDTETLSVGSLMLGANYVVNDRFAIDVSVNAGLTEDAPDIRLLVKLPFFFDLS